MKSIDRQLDVDASNATGAQLKDHFQRANDLHVARDYGGAIAEMQAVFRLAPEMPEAHFNMGNILRDSGNLPLAVEAFETAFRCAKTAGRAFPEALINLGATLTAAKRFDEALGKLIEATRLYPDLMEVHRSLGVLYYSMRNFVKAAGAYAKALEIEPDNPFVLDNIALLEYHMGQPQAALATYDRIYAIAPHLPDQRLNRAIMLLLHGLYEEGFEEYEARWQTRHFMEQQVRTGMPEWHGETLEQKTIIAYAEQGFGDSFQFARYIKVLNARGAIVVALVRPEAESLIATVPGVVTTATIGSGVVPPHDYVVPLVSLPHRLGLMPDHDKTIYAPYLFPPSHRSTHWHGQLASLKKFKVGIVWAGRPEHAFDDDRSIKLSMLQPLSEIPGISLVSLQQGPHADDRSFDLYRPGTLEDFTETAAIIKNLDLVITVDTAVCHLAGAMGVETWTLLSSVPEWRWGLSGERTMWYPSMRLFRQGAKERWADVIWRIKQALEDFTTQ